MTNSFFDGAKRGAAFLDGCAAKRPDVMRPSGDSNDHSWPDPRPIPDSLLPVIPFDFQLLPESLRPWVADISERMQCPPDFVAVGAMTALSSVIGRKACIAPKRHDDWRVTPNLWAMVVGRPGIMKSPSLMEVMKPLYRLQEEADKSFYSILRDFELNAELRDMSGKAAKGRAREAVLKGNEREARELLEASMAESDGPPARRRYVTNDCTMEALGEILIENPWGILAYRDELHGLLCSLEKEGQEGARSFYLQGYDGNQSYTFDRIGRGKNLSVPAVCVALLGGVQPGKLAAYIRDAVSGGARDDGLLQRFGLLVWPDGAPDWKNVDRYPDKEAKQKAFETFQRLDEMPPALSETGENVPREYRFAPGAQEIFDTWRCAFENDLRQNSDRHPAMESHLSKYRKLVPALALVIALADGEDAVSRGSLLMSLGWAKYLQSHAERAYATGTGPRVDSARALLNKIRKGDLQDGFSSRAVYRKGWGGLATERGAAFAAEMLCDLGYLRPVEIPSGATGGRPTVNYLIHPDYLPKGEA